MKINKYTIVAFLTNNIHKNPKACLWFVEL